MQLPNLPLFLEDNHAPIVQITGRLGAEELRSWRAEWTTLMRERHTAQEAGGLFQGFQIRFGGSSAIHT